MAGPVRLRAVLDRAGGAVKRDPVAEYIAAHPDRVHQGATPPAASRARDKPPPVDREPSLRGQLQGWCSVTRQPIYGGETAVRRHMRDDHPGRPGCRIGFRVVEGPDGKYRFVEPEWPD